MTGYSTSIFANVTKAVKIENPSRLAYRKYRCWTTCNKHLYCNTSVKAMTRNTMTLQSIWEHSPRAISSKRFKHTGHLVSDFSKLLLKFGGWGNQFIKIVIWQNINKLLLRVFLKYAVVLYSFIIYPYVNYNLIICLWLMYKVQLLFLYKNKSNFENTTLLPMKVDWFNNVRTLRLFTVCILSAMMN